MIRLEVTAGLGRGSRHESTADVVRLGRSADNDVVLPDEHVSGEHARIVYGGERYVLRDLRSTNGTAIVRGDQRLTLDDGNGRAFACQEREVPAREKPPTTSECARTARGGIRPAEAIGRSA